MTTTSLCVSESHKVARFPLDDRTGDCDHNDVSDEDDDNDDDANDDTDGIDVGGDGGVDGDCVDNDGDDKNLFLQAPTPPHSHPRQVCMSRRHCAPKAPNLHRSDAARSQATKGRVQQLASATCRRHTTAAGRP